MQKHFVEFTLWKMTYLKNKSRRCHKCEGVTHREERLYHVLSHGWRPPMKYEVWHDTGDKAIEFTEECKKCGWKTVYRWYPQYYNTLRRKMRVVAREDVWGWTVGNYTEVVPF